MNVPTPERQVGVQASEVGMPQVQPVTPAASGANIGEAAAGLGRTMEQAGAELARPVAEHNRMMAEADVFSKFVDFSNAHAQIMHSVDPQTGQLNTDPKTGKPSGVLDRMGKDAAGATAEYNARTTDLLNKTMKGLDSPYKQYVFGQMARRTLMYGVDNVNGHEASQARVYSAQSANAAIAAKGQDAALNLPPDTDKAVSALHNYVTDAQAIALRQAGNEGVQDPNMLAMRKQEAADHVASSAVMARLDQDPQKARDLLSSTDIQKELSPAMLQKLQGTVEGKWLELHANNIFGQAPMTAQGQVDRSEFDPGIERFIENAKDIHGQPYSDFQKDAMKQHLSDDLARQADAKDRQVADSARKQFLSVSDAAVKLRDAKIPLAQAQEQILKNASQIKVGTDTLDTWPNQMDTYRQQIAGIYGESAAAEAHWRANLSDDMQQSLALAESTIDGSFAKNQILKTQDGTSFRPAELAKKQLMDMVKARKLQTPDQVSDYVQKMTQKAPVQGTGVWGWFQSKRYGIQDEASRQEDEPLRSLALKTLAANNKSTDDKSVATFLAANHDWLRGQLGK